MSEKTYVYLFTRQDISPEQQIVQTSHAAYKLGECIGSDDYNYASADETHFTVVGVRNKDALYAVIDILDTFGFAYEVFTEPDLNGGEKTSIATYPILENDRDVLLAFNLLKL